MFLSMNKNLVLISSIGLFLAGVHNSLSNHFFSISYCLHEAMQNLRHGGVVTEFRYQCWDLIVISRISVPFYSDTNGHLCAHLVPKEKVFIHTVLNNILVLI